MRSNLLPNDLTEGQVVIMHVHGLDGMRFWAGKVRTIDVKENQVSIDGYPYKAAMKTFRLTLRSSGKPGYDAATGELIQINEATGNQGQRLIQMQEEMASISLEESATVVKRVVRREPTPVTPGVCLCGCGGATRGGKFAPGHDAKVKGLLKKIVRGELPASAIPVPFAENYESVAFCVDNPEFMKLMRGMSEKAVA